MWLAAPPLSSSPALFPPLSLLSSGVIIIIDMVVVVVPVCCVMWWLGCTRKSLEIFVSYFSLPFTHHMTLVQNNTLLSHTLHLYCLYSCHHQHQRWTATISIISNTNARDDKCEGRGRWTNRGAQDASASWASDKFLFFLSFFCSANIFFYYNYITSVWTTTATTNTHLHHHQQHFEFQCVIFFSVFFLFFFLHYL